MVSDPLSRITENFLFGKYSFGFIMFPFIISASSEYLSKNFFAALIADSDCSIPEALNPFSRKNFK